MMAAKYCNIVGLWVYIKINPDKAVALLPKGQAAVRKRFAPYLNPELLNLNSVTN